MASLHSVADEQDGFDLDRHAIGQRAHADRRAGMPPGITQHLDQQIGAAVDDLRVIGEVRFRIDHAEQLDDGLDAAEFAESRFRDGQQIEPGQAGILIGLFDGRIAAEATRTVGAVRRFGPCPERYSRFPAQR